MNNNETENSFFKNMPKEVRENMEKQGGLYATLCSTITQPMDTIITRYMGYVNTIHEDRLEYIVNNEAEHFCHAFDLPSEFSCCISEPALVILGAMRYAIKKCEFTKWYDEKYAEYGSQVVNGERDKIIIPRILEVEPETTEGEFKDKIRNDMLNFLPEEEVNEQFEETCSTARLNGRKLESTKKSSYNKGKKKTHGKSSKS